MDDDPLAASRDEIIAHMNGDHADALARYLRAFRDVDAAPDDVRLTAVSAEGFTVTHRSRGEFEFSWRDPVEGPDDVRMELVKLAREARRVLAERGT